MPEQHDIILVHSSDLHLGFEAQRGQLHALDLVLDTAERVQANVILLAGDVFDHNRVPVDLLDRAARRMASAERPIVILPGNHDCLVTDSVYRRGGLADPENVCVIGISVDEAILLPDLDLEIWGRPHLDYGDMSPLGGPRARSTRWQVAAAHGHWLRGPEDRHRSYLIHDEQIAQIGADYLALGHWDVAAPAGDGRVPAYYSGAPTYAGTVNVVRLNAGAVVQVTREPASVSPSPVRNGTV